MGKSIYKDVIDIICTHMQMYRLLCLDFIDKTWQEERSYISELSEFKQQTRFMFRFKNVCYSEN